MADSHDSHAPRTPFRIWQAFQWSMKGLRAAWQVESSFRLEVYLCIVLVPLGLYLGQTGIERFLLVSVLLLVLIVEVLNSAIEAVVDRWGPEHHDLAGRAKDVRVTTRLVDSPACLVVQDAGMSMQLARMLKQAGQAAPEVKPVLEVNAEHALVKKLDGSAQFDDLAQVLFDQAVLATQANQALAASSHADMMHDAVRADAQMAYLLVDTAQGRAAVAADKSRRVEPRRPVEPVLIHQDTQERLDAGDEDSTVREQKFVVERHFLVAHRNFFPFGPPLTDRTII